MNLREERRWIERAIVALEKKILKNPKGKIFLVEELKALQKDLSGLYVPEKEKFRQTRKIEKQNHLQKGEKQ